MGNARDTGYLQNIVTYDANDNIVLPADLSIGGSNGFYWDNTNKRLGIGTNVPATALDVKSFIQADTYAAGTIVAHNSGYLRLISAGKTGWASGDELGKIEFFGSDTSGIGARNAASIRAINTQGNGTTTTTFNGELAFYTSAANALESEKVRISSAGVSVQGALVTTADVVVNSVSIGRGPGNISTNTSVGTNALSANTTGTSNVAYGFDSLRNNTTGSGNTAYGRESLFNNTTGGLNIAIGINAGRHIANGTTANAITNNSIFLGALTRANADNETNQIVIGHTAIGLGSNTTVIGNSSTTFGRWFGNLLIGTSTNNGAMLQVSGGATFSSFGRFGGWNIATNFGVNTGANTSIYMSEVDSSTVELSAVNNTNTAVRILRLQSPGGGTQIGGTLAVTGSATFLSTLNGTSGNFSGNIQLGTIGGGSSTATPNSINLASTFSNTAGSNLKLKLFEDTGANIYGIGVSNNQMDFNIPSGATYRFYTGAATFSNSITTTSLTTGTSTGSSVNITTNNNNGTSGSPLQTNVNFYGFNGNLNGQIRVDDIAGTAQVGTMKFYTWNSGQVLALTLAQTGAATFSSSVGIGTNPSYALHISAFDGAFALTGTRGTGTTHLWYTSGVNNQNLIFNNPNGDSYFYSNGNAVLSVTTNRYVGIGLNGPSTKLHIVDNFDPDDALGYLLVENTNTTSGAAATNASSNVKNYHGTSQFMQWQSFGLRIGSRILTNGGVGDVIFTAGADSEKLRILAGGGITFNGDTAAANALDDYEEGTWTPVVYIGGTINTGTGRGRYTKIGNVVYIQATITSITKSGTGGLTVEGLPFTIGTSGTFGDVQGTLRWDDITSSGVIYPYFSSDQTRIIFQDFSNTGYVNTVQDSQISSTYQLYGISGFYMV